MKKILIIDDSATLRRIVHDSLEVLEMEIFEADGATKAFECLEKNPIDLILLDWHMPEMEGY
ncbi:MAG: response regulator, partial [Deltaproteobacteria bacterium]|nr:response regulator [Deltaproteobacteria bacterium]